MSYHEFHNAEDRKEIMKGIFNALAPHRRSFKSILCTGQSGIVPASILAHAWGKEIVILRKEDEPCYSSNMVEGFLHGPFIWLDDFADTGKTLKRLRDAHPYGRRVPPRFVVLYGCDRKPGDQVMRDVWDFKLVATDRKFLFTFHPLVKET